MTPIGVYAFQTILSRADVSRPKYMLISQLSFHIAGASRVRCSLGRMRIRVS